MQYPYYEFSVPVFSKMLGSLSHLLDVASVHATAKHMSEHEILEARLAPDMFPLLRQVQVCCDNAKGAAARLAGVAVPAYEDTETTIAELKARIEKTVVFIESLTPEQFADAAERHIELPYFPGKHMTGDGYLRQYALPNFFFHLTTVDAILRAGGADMGKADFMHGLPLIQN